MTDALARRIAFGDRYQVNLPPEATGVWTLRCESMSTENRGPTSGRTVHVVCYGGRILADLRIAD